jgi:hypothetical protein
MFATARCASAIAVTGAILLGGASPALAADRMNDKPFTTVDFALTNIAPFAPIVKPATFVAAAVAEPEAEKIADAPQMRPVDIAMPGAGAGSTSLRRSMYVSFAALQVMDAVSTSKALSSGASEANPVMSGFVKNKAAFYGIKAATAVSTIFFAERLGKNHPRRAAVVMAILNVGYAAIVAHNYRVASAR